MNKTSIPKYIFFVVPLVGLGIATSAFAAIGTSTDQTNGIAHGRHGAMSQDMRQRHQAVHDAIENNDYAAFQVAIGTSGEGHFAEVIDTQEKFAKLVEAEALKHDGDIAGAKAILTELGLPTMGARGHGALGAKHTAIHAAIESGDYATFKTLVAENNGPLGDLITSEEAFEKLAEAHELRRSGDHEAAHVLMQELGFPEKKEHGRFKTVAE